MSSFAPDWIFNLCSGMIATEFISKNTTLPAIAKKYSECIAKEYNLIEPELLEEASVFNFEGRLVNSRETYNENDRRKIWEDSRNRSRNRKNKELNKTLVLIIIILISIFLYIIDFDLSIFYNK